MQFRRLSEGSLSGVDLSLRSWKWQPVPQPAETLPTGLNSMNDDEKQELLWTMFSNLAKMRHEMLNNADRRLEEKKQGQKLLNRSQAATGEAQSSR
jgi:hypothetical protein